MCHGIPGEKKLKPGDIVNVDVTVIKDGWHGDSSRMFYVGTPSIQARRLVETTYEAMWRGIRVVRPGAHLGDIGHTIQKFAEGHGYSIVREFCGHGIGAQFHEEPQVLHYGRPGTGLQLAPGMVFTIEPMINAGRAAIRSLADGWTIVTADHSLSAQWEHTVAVTNDGFEVLTVVRPARRRPRVEPFVRAALDARGAPAGGPRPPLPRRARRGARVAPRGIRTRAPTRRASSASPRGPSIASSRRSGASSPRRRISHWSPSAATDAASCSRIPTSTS